MSTRQIVGKWRRHVGIHLASLVAVFGVFALFFVDLASASAAGDPPGAKDWMNSPLIGSGTVPEGDTTVFFSAYLDRILYLDEQRYTYAVSMYVFLSWQAKGAYAQLQNATAETMSGAPGARDCARMCIGQRAPSETSQCCDTIWLPSLLIRNADELPQGRLQPYYITVSPEDIVTWRLQFRSDFYTSLDVQSFPFDFQNLEVFFQLVNLPGAGRVRVVPSARGLHLFSLGWGDDLSGFKTTSLRIFVDAAPFSKQFDRYSKYDANINNIKSVDATAAVAQAKAREQVEARSDPKDPAPLVPALVPDPANKSKVVPISEPFGTDIEVVNVIVVIVLKRLWQYYVISAIIPTLTATLLSFVVFAVPPSKLDTRLQTAIGLFLSLVAVQFVIENDLPKSSYVIPTRMLVLASYVCLGLIAIESLVVFNLWHWPEVRTRLAGRREAVKKHAEITRLKMMLQQSRARSGSGSGRGGARSSLAEAVLRRWQLAAKGAETNSDGNESGTDMERGGGGGRGWANQLMASVTQRRSPLPTPVPPPTMTTVTMTTTAAGGGGAGRRGGALGASAGGDQRREEEIVARPPNNNGNEGDVAGAAGGKMPLSPRSSPGSRGRGRGAGAVPSSRPTAATTNAATSLLLEEELEKALWHYRAWRVDVISFWTMLILYFITAILIFGISVLVSRRAAASFSYSS